MRPSPSARRALGVLAVAAALLLATIASTAVAAGSQPPARATAAAVKPKAKSTSKSKRPSKLTRCLRRARKAHSKKARASRRRACLRAAKREKAKKAKAARRKQATATPPPAPSPAPSTGTNSFGSDVYGLAAGGAIQGEDSTTLGRDLDSIQGTHTHWLRVDVNWAQIQGGGPSSYNWTAVDRLVQGASARGIKVLAGILYTPGWARPSGTSATYGPDPNTYASFAATAVRHYAAMGVHTYEIWNEANTTSFWTPKPNPAAYTSLLKATYPAIKAADASATVLTAGTAPAPSDGTQLSPVDFLKGIYANGGAGSFDAVAHHPYCWPANPGDAQTWSSWYQMYGTSPSLRSVMTDNGDAAKKIWATEFGAPTNGPSGSYVSEATQASMLTKAYQLYRSYTWAGPLFFYQGRDQSATDTSTRENFFGLTHNDFTPKPAYTAYQQATTS